MGALNSTLASEPLMSAGAAAAVVVVSAVVYATQTKPTATESKETVVGETESASMKKQGRRGKRAAKGTRTDGTPAALAAQAALFESETKSSGAEDGSGSMTKSKSKKRSKKAADPSPLAAPVKKASKEQSKAKPKLKATPTPTSLPDREDVEEEEEEAEEEPLSYSAPVGGKAGKGTFNKFASLGESQISTTPSMDASWLQVSQNTRKKGGVAKNAESSSDAGMTNTSTDEAPKVNSLAALESKLGREKIKTSVDDMLPPDPAMARVMRVTNPNDTDDMMQSTDADEEEGWGIVRRRRTPKPNEPSSAGVSTPPAEPTKDQRRREAKKELAKEAKAEAEADRLAQLAKHRKEQEKARMEEIAKKVGKGNKVSGGMRAVVNNEGKLVWE